MSRCVGRVICKTTSVSEAPGERCQNGVAEDGRAAPPPEQQSGCDQKGPGGPKQKPARSASARDIRRSVHQFTPTTSALGFGMGIAELIFNLQDGSGNP